MRGPLWRHPGPPENPIRSSPGKAVVLAAAAGSRAAYSINAGIARGLLPVANRSEASA